MKKQWEGILSICHLTACDDSRGKYMRTQAVCAKRLNVERWHIKCLQCMYIYV